MDDPRWEPGMPVLDRQTVPDRQPVPAAAAARGASPPRSIAESAPTPLQPYYINLSAVGLVCGAVAITALELGAGLGDAIVKVPVLIGAPILLVTTADAVLRIWRSARAWLPVNRGRGLFRMTWVVAGLVGWLVIAAAGWLVVSA